SVLLCLIIFLCRLSCSSFFFFFFHFLLVFFIFFFFFNDTATTEIYTLSLHDALPISPSCRLRPFRCCTSLEHRASAILGRMDWRDRKSTRLNSSHLVISYAVFCLKKKKKTYKYK